MKKASVPFRFLSQLSIILTLGMSSCQNPARAQVSTEITDPVPETAPPAPRSIKLAILLDTSGSMDGLIEQAKSQLWNIVNELAKAECDGLKPALEIALYQYGNDRLSPREGYIEMVTPLTTDLDQISADLFKLTTNGGSEFCGHVIQTSLNQLAWAENDEDYKVIFIAGNEPFTQGNVPYARVCGDAREKGIIVNTIYCGNFNEGINTSWKNGADITLGKYMSIDHNSKTEFITSPYDDRIAHLNTKLNTTYIAYGRKGKERMEMMEAQDANSIEYGQANMVKRAVSKSSHVYKSKDWDLVDAVEEKEVDLTKMASGDLPKELQGKSTTEIEAYVQAKASERLRIKNEIQELNQKRETFVAEQRKDSAALQLDDVILSAIRAQAKAQKFTFPGV